MRRAWVLLGITALAACGPEEFFSAPALIVFSGDTASINAPARVSAGTPFTLSVQTFGGGCTREVAETRVSTSASVVEIRPLNRTRRFANCTDDIRFLFHFVTVTLHQAGTATIRVIGDQRPFQGDNLRSGPVQLERTIIVQ